MKKIQVAILSIVIIITIVLTISPVNAQSFPEYSNVTPYGAEFKQPGLGGWAYRMVDETIEKDWSFEFWLTPAQNEQLTKMAEDNPDLTIYDGFTQIVPAQVAALPEDLQEYLKTALITPKSDSYPSFQHGIYTSPDGKVTDEWIDPSGNVVPESCVPERYLHPNPSDPGFYFIQYYADGRSPEYTPGMQQHLTNLGLSSAYRSDIAATSYFLDDGSYAITLTGSSPSGEELSWTFVLGNDRVWRDSATGQPMDDDARFVLAAMNYVDLPSAFSVNALTTVAQARTGTVSSIPTVTSHSPSTLANTLLSHAGTSKLSKVNISSFAATKPTITSTASTASLVSQDTVSSAGETTAGGNFDMASIAASYRSGGTAIASKGFGSDVLAARGIGG
jgi:hypothetical protein